VIQSIDVVLDRTDPALLIESIKALLHSIFFHRVFGNVQPLTRDILDVTFPYTDDPDLESLIDSQTRSFLRYIDTHPPPTVGPSADVQGDITQLQKEGAAKSQVAIHFYEKVTRRASWWASKAAESEVCWEKWELNCQFLPIARTEREKTKARRIMENQLSAALLKIVMLTQKTDHIPPITTNEANPFPYQIVVPSSTVQPVGLGMDGEGWGAVLKKTLFDATTGQN